ncbi:hypothetical protein Gotri_022555, partial [Gossypium trilobum]|nr:hypothetical protein [Gossypium trilobum]
MDEPPDLDDLMMNEKRVRVEGFVTQPVSWKEKLIGSVPVEKPLVSKMRIDGKVQHVEYESLQLVCFECGRFGHKSDLCPHGSGEIEVSKGVSKGRVSKEISMKDRVEAEKFGILSGSLGDIDGNKSAILNGREENKEFGEEIVEN